MWSCVFVCFAVTLQIESVFKSGWHAVEQMETEAQARSKSMKQAIPFCCYKFFANCAGSVPFV